MSMRVPLVWILRGPKAGDYAQLQLIARAMNVPATTKQLVFKRWELLLHAFPRPTLAALDRSKSDPLEAPWPDLVFTAGRRNELVGALDSRRVRQPLAHRARRQTVVEPE